MANDEIDALDALEKEAKEYDKVRTLIGLMKKVLKLLGRRNRSYTQRIQTRRVSQSLSNLSV